MTALQAAMEEELSATTAWSRRVRRVGGFIQVAFAALWLGRGALDMHSAAGPPSAVAFGTVVLLVLAYGIAVAAGTGARPSGREAKRIERSVTVATVIELAASFVLPVVAVAAGHADWVLPSIAITMGPLLLWLDQEVHIPRYRPVGWALIIGTVVLVATMSGPALVAATGISAGLLLLSTAALGFRDLASFGRPGLTGGGGSARMLDEC